MKKAILALAAIVTITLPAAAQDGKSARLGLKVAPNMSWINPSESRIKSDGSVTGFNFGLMADFRLGNDNYALATGLFYMVRTGGKYKMTLTDSSSTTATAKLQYVQLPLTIKLKTNEIGYITYFGQIGADLGINVGATGDVTTMVGRSTTTLKDEDISDNIALFRAGLLVGAGLEYNFSGNTSALVGINYSNGLTNVFDKDAGKAKLSYIELALGILF